VLSPALAPSSWSPATAPDEVRAALGGRPVTFVHAPDYEAGLSASLKTGIATVPETACRRHRLPRDMPLVTGRIIDRLIAAYDADEGRAIVVADASGPRRQPDPVGPPLLPRNSSDSPATAAPAACCDGTWKTSQNRCRRRRRAARLRHRGQPRHPAASGCDR